MSQITLRDLPEPLEREIRREATRRGLSLNKTIIGILQEGLGMSPAFDRKRDMSALSGTWDEQAYAEFREATTVFQKIDEENWQT